MAHEALHLDGVHAGVKEIGGEGTTAVVGTEVADAGLAGPAVDQGVDGLSGEAPDGDSPALSMGQKRGPFSSRPRTSSHAAMTRRPPAGKGGAALASALAGHCEVAGGGVVVLDVERNGFGPTEAADEEHGQDGGVSAADLAVLHVAAGRQAAASHVVEVDGSSPFMRPRRQASRSTPRRAARWRLAAAGEQCSASQDRRA
jgi:hypothetical protein